MRLPRTRVNLSMFILGSIIICLSFCIIIKRQSLFAESIPASQQSSQENADHHITIHNGKEKLTIRSSAPTVAAVLERADIKVGEYDRIYVYDSAYGTTVIDIDLNCSDLVGVVRYIENKDEIKKFTPFSFILRRPAL